MNGQPDDDRAIEHLLRREMAGDPDPVTAACIDAERLAAWSEGGLSPAEREAIEAHMASCARCLSMLAALEDASADAGPRTEPAADVRVFVPAGGRERAPWWRSPVGWLVPVTTAAAAVLIWMVLPARQPGARLTPESEPVQFARDEAASAAPVAPPAAQPAPAPPPERSDAGASSAAQEAAAPAAPAAPPPAIASAPEPPADAERRRQESAFGRSADADAASARADTAEPQRAAKAIEEMAAADRPAAAAPRAPAPGIVTGGTAGALFKAEVAPIEIPSPDPAIRWRIRGTMVDRSTDAGASWQTATLPAGAVVTAGHSPSPGVCWLVGPAGTVLRSTDGERFDAVSVPNAGALIAVQSENADEATVTSVSGRVYATSDGGRAWK